ncbi:hypothetical protein [Desulfitobacterium sp. PCE1]|uniref:hypothetical protein n=1 Tax=Desulfitobacterium sp. PCE1 TaxID=146907 RepID=UPI00035EAED5|nr:hypothetical protein [Desulfitobacterium sp. PCE1]
MSRAFVSENDGWYRCVKHREHCMMANEKGNCLLDHCQQYPEKDKKEEKEPPNKNK